MGQEAEQLPGQGQDIPLGKPAPAELSVDVFGQNLHGSRVFLRREDRKGLCHCWIAATLSGSAERPPSQNHSKSLNWQNGRIFRVDAVQKSELEYALGREHAKTLRGH